MVFFPSGDYCTFGGGGLPISDACGAVRRLTAATARQADWEVAPRIAGSLPDA